MKLLPYADFSCVLPDGAGFSIASLRAQHGGSQRGRGTRQQGDIDEFAHDSGSAFRLTLNLVVLMRGLLDDLTDKLYQIDGKGSATLIGPEILYQALGFRERDIRDDKRDSPTVNSSLDARFDRHI